MSYADSRWVAGRTSLDLARLISIRTHPRSLNIVVGLGWALAFKLGHIRASYQLTQIGPTHGLDQAPAGPVSGWLVGQASSARVDSFYIYFKNFKYH